MPNANRSATMPVGRRRAAACGAAALAALALVAATLWPLRAQAQAQQPPAPPALPPVTAIPALNVPAYMGTWYQMAWFPNRFQKQCVSDTTATYRQLPGGEVEVTNRCKLENGGTDSVVGLARPAGAVIRGDLLQPAQLEVSFLPPLLRWLPIWGSYWVLELAPDGRYAVVSEPSRQYLWVLTRQPQLAPADETAIRSRLAQAGFDLARWTAHPHGARAAAATAAPASAP